MQSAAVVALMPLLILLRHTSQHYCFLMDQTAPENCFFPLRVLPPHLIHGSLGPPESTRQSASRSVQPLLQGSWTWRTDSHTVTNRHTDRPRYSVCTNRPRLAIVVMRHNDNDVIISFKIITIINVPLRICDIAE